MLPSDWGRGLYLVSQAKDDKPLGVYNGEEVESLAAWQELTGKGGKYHTLDIRGRLTNGIRGMGMK